MRLPSLTTLSAVLLASEAALAFSRHAGKSGERRDRHTLPLLWLVIGLSIFLGIELRGHFPSGRLPSPAACYLAGLALFLLGLIVRWAAIIYLGRFFTVNVAIAQNHKLITTGPLSFYSPPFLQRIAPYFPRLWPVHAESLFPRSDSLPDHGRLSLAHPCRGNRSRAGFRRPLPRLYCAHVAGDPVDLLAPWTAGLRRRVSVFVRQGSSRGDGEWR